MSIRRKLWVLGVLIVAITTLFPTALADRGMIPLEPGVSVYEPGQSAIVAWNQGREVLILSTNVTADRETEVLEIVPLPSVPKIRLGEFESFQMVETLIRMHGPAVYKTGRDEGAIWAEPGVKIILHEKIGAHDITVVEANDYEEFIEWTRRFIGEAEVPPRLEEVIEHYLKNRIKYFAFDFISVTEKERSVEPLVYEFASPYPYYPLVISTLMPGKTNIRLFLLLEYLEPLFWSWPAPLKLASYQLGGKPLAPVIIPLRSGQLTDIDPRIGELFGFHGPVWLVALHYEGPLDRLRADLKLTVYPWPGPE